MAKIKYVLDACSVIAYLRKEEGFNKMIEVLNSEEGVVTMHAINLCEVFYDFFRASGKQDAENAVHDFLQIGVVIRRDMDNDFLKIVGQVKVENRISLADSFAVALTQREDASLVSTDHHDFDPLCESGCCKFLFIR